MCIELVSRYMYIKIKIRTLSSYPATGAIIKLFNAINAIDLFHLHPTNSSNFTELDFRTTTSSLHIKKATDNHIIHRSFCVAFIYFCKINPALYNYKYTIWLYGTAPRHTVTLSTTSLFAHLRFAFFML